MLVSRFFAGNKTLGDNGQTDRPQHRLLSIGLLLLAGLSLGILLAWFIVGQHWSLIFGLFLLIPVLILSNTYPFAGLIVWLLVNPFLQTAPNAEVRMMYWMIHRALPPFLVGTVMLARLLKVNPKRQPVGLGWADWATVLYLGLGVLNILWLQPSPSAYLYWFYDRVFSPVCLYWFIRLAPPSEKDIRRLIPIAFVLVVAECVIGALAWFAPQVLPAEWLGYQGARTTGTLTFPHAYTTTLIFFSFLLFQEAMHCKSRLIRYMFLLTFGFSAICVFLSFSRGSWLGAIAAAIGLLLMYPKATLRLAVVLVVLMSILGSGALSREMAFAQERMNSEDTANDRWVIWNAGLQMIYAKPLFGWGYGNYSLYAKEFQTRVNNYVAAGTLGASHNNYIAIAAELGLPAFFLFLFPALWWLMLTLKVLQRMPPTGFWSRSLLIVFWMVILDHIIVNQFSDMSRSMYGMGMWWITLGLIANMVFIYLQPADMKLPAWAQHAGHAD